MHLQLLPTVHIKANISEVTDEEVFQPSLTSVNGQRCCNLCKSITEPLAVNIVYLLQIIIPLCLISRSGRQFSRFTSISFILFISWFLAAP